MRIRYYAYSFFWFYSSLIIEFCIRPVRPLGGQQNLTTIHNKFAHRQSPPLIATPPTASIINDEDDDRINSIKANNNNFYHQQVPSNDWLNLLEKHLLTKMGMKNRPRPKRKIVIPDKLRELYDQLTTTDVDVDDDINLRDNDNPIWDSARSFFPEPDDDANVPTNVLTFDLTDLPSRERIEGADLALLLEDKFKDNSQTDSNDENGDSLSSSTVYLRLSISDTIRNHTVLMDTVQVKCGGGNRANSDVDRWLTFDVSSAIRRWLMSQTKTGRLQIDVHSRSGADRLCGVHLHRTASPSSSSSKRSLDGMSQAPVLIVYTSDIGWNDSSRSRTKRDAHLSKRYPRSSSTTSNGGVASTKQKKHRKNRQKTNRRPELCRRRDLHIDFESVGWNDWIVAPTGYDAFYCSGECIYPLPDFLNATNHAIVQTLVHSVNPGAAPKSCCVPTELGQISMLYLDEFDKVVLKTYQDMVVVGCGCR